MTGSYRSASLECSVHSVEFVIIFLLIKSSKLTALYLNVICGLQLETTAERIKAVDAAAAMVEDILKQASSSDGVKVIIVCNL